MSRFSVAELFSDHMVLRHSRLNPVWGEADVGARIHVYMGEETASCTADSQGQWMLRLPTPGAGFVGSLKVSCGNETILFKDVACGEVWLAAGQSNMEQPLMCASDARPWADSAPCTRMRLKTIPRRCTKQKQAGWHFYPTQGEDEPWHTATRERAAQFSAIGYMFGAMLSEKLNMPVGIIECNWGGTKIQSWLPTRHLLLKEDTRRDVQEYLAIRESLGDDAHKAFVAYRQSVIDALAAEPDFVENNLKDPMNFLNRDRDIAFMPLGSEADPQQPGVLFDTMVARVAPYGLSGVLWYQGEANALQGECQRYGSLFSRLLDTWRSAWQDPLLPFLTCQLAPFRTGLYWQNADWPCLREQQHECARHLQHVSMAVLLDVGMERNIHPLNKQTVADRLCRLALEDVYSIPAQAHAAQPVSCAWDQDCLLVHFSAPVKLQAGLLPCLKTKEGEEPCHVKQIAPCTLKLCPPLRQGVIGVSYAQVDWLQPGLFDQNGLPVAPFVLNV